MRAWKSRLLLVFAVAILSVLDARGDPGIDVRGADGSLILNGDAVPSISDGTDFGIIKAAGVSVTNTFTITNSGLDTLYLTTSQIVALTGNSGDFMVDTNGMATNIATMSSTTFNIIFAPTTLGVKTGIVSIASNDGDKDPYVFCILGIAADGMPVNEQQLRRIGVNCGNSARLIWPGGGVASTTLNPGDVTGVAPQGNWNNVLFDYTTESPGSIVRFGSLIDDLGATTGAAGEFFDDWHSMNLIAWDAIGTQFNNPASPIQKLFHCAAACWYGIPVGVTVTGVPYRAYSVVVYGVIYQGNVTAGGTLTPAGGTGITRYIYTNAANYNAFDDATEDGTGNYLVFDGLTNGAFTYLESANESLKLFCGIQIVERPTPPLIDNTPGALHVTATNALLNGTLQDSGSGPAEVWVYWGRTDSGTNEWGWEYTNYFGYNASACPTVMSTNVTLPAADTIYYYRFKAANAIGTNWASYTTNFINDFVYLSGIDTNASETWPDTGSFRVWRSAAATSHPVVVNYTLGGSAVSDVDYIPLSGQTLIPAGATNADVVVIPIDDIIPYQTNHFVTITLAEGGYRIGIPGSAVVVISENDTNNAYRPGSIGITFGDGTQGPPLGSHTGPGVAQDFWNNVDVRPWRTYLDDWNHHAAGISIWTGFGPYETNEPTIIATRDSHNQPVSIGFLTFNMGHLRAWDNGVPEQGPFWGPRWGWGEFTGTAPAGPNTTNYDQKILSYATGIQGPSDSNNWIRISGIPYDTYNVYIWATNCNLGLTNTGVYFNGPTNFDNLSGEFFMEGARARADQAGWADAYRGISYIQIVEVPFPTVNNEPGPIQSADGSAAWLRGTLISTNGSPAELWVYWGLTDGGANVANWGNTNYLGINTGACPATNSVKVFLPLPNATYYYRYCASNAVGLGWANSTTNFGNHGGTVLFVR